MKKYNIRYIFYILLPALLLSCKEDRPTAEDHMINFEIEEVPVTEDYLIGVKYGVPMWFENLIEEPALGRYGETGEISVKEAMQQHIAWANKYGIDFFIFNIYNDTALLDTFQAVSSYQDINFALRFDHGFLKLKNNNRLHLDSGNFETLVDTFKTLLPYFELSNYQKIDGHHLVYINNAHDILSDSSGNQPVYDELRSRIQAEGYELYLLGEQPEWTPPARYEHRLRECVDAVTHKRMIYTWMYDRYLYFPQFVYLNWEYSKEYFEGWGAEFVPQIQPAFTEKVVKNKSSIFDFEGGEKFFREYCNIAKKHVSSHRLIIIDSFNEWSLNMQIEPSKEKGTLYLEIVKNEFKVN